MSILDYISRHDNMLFCSNCADECGYQCVVWCNAKLKKEEHDEKQLHRGPAQGDK